MPASLDQRISAPDDTLGEVIQQIRHEKDIIASEQINYIAEELAKLAEQAKALVGLPLQDAPE